MKTNGFKTEIVELNALRPHPRNYRTHPDDQIEHLVESIREHGFYRNVVIARDNTILAGHGVVDAARKAGMAQVPVVRLDIDSLDVRALKVLAGDNEIMRLGEIDDRALSEMLKEISDADLTGLLGTGYDEMMLANLIFVTRPRSEVPDADKALQWAGMPDYEPRENPFKCVVNFDTIADRDDFAQRLGVTFSGETITVSMWWPPRENDDVSSVKWEAEPA